MPNIIPIERIEREALAAAKRYTDLNAACPYPFDSDAGHVFKAFFLQARRNMVENDSSTHGACASSY